MLTIYRSKSDIPDSMEYWSDNDAFFDAKSILLDTDLVKSILLKIDGAERISDDTFLGRNKSFGTLSRIHLSTGSKTLINIANYSNICFDVKECGMNALDILPELSVTIDGYILWERCIYSFPKDADCDIVYNGKRYRRVIDYMRGAC